MATNKPAMRVVWKYRLNSHTLLQGMDLPKGSVLLAVGVQDNEPVVWWLVDPTAPSNAIERRYLRLVLTGQSDVIDLTCYRYVETIQLEKGINIVLHCFEWLPDVEMAGE